MTSWTAWLEATIPTDASVRSVAAATGVDNKSAGRWLESPRADFVIKVARAYDASPIAGLVAAGFLTDDEVDEHAIENALHSATDLELAEETLRRVRDGGTHAALTEPLGGRASGVRELRPGNQEAGAASDEYESLADAADDAPDWEDEEAGLTREP